MLRQRCYSYSGPEKASPRVVFFVLFCFFVFFFTVNAVNKVKKKSFSHIFKKRMNSHAVWNPTRRLIRAFLEVNAFIQFSVVACT